MTAGRVTGAVIERLGIPVDADVYLCGPAAFMTDLTAAFGALGFAPSRLRTETFGTLGAITPGVVGSPDGPPRLPDGPPGTGPAVTFARSGLTARWDDRYGSVLELAEACRVPVRWSCRTGVCHTCETSLVSGDVAYEPEPVDAPALGNVLVCCAQPRTTSSSISRTARRSRPASASEMAQAALTRPMWLNAWGKLPKQLAVDRVDLFGEQADVVDERGGPFEHGARPVGLARHRQGLGEPEGAEQEGAFLAVEAVAGAVAVDQPPLVREPFLRGVDGRQHPGVVGGKEPDQGQHQVGGVQIVGAEGLGERADPVAPALAQDGLTDLVLGVRPGLDPVGSAEAVGQRRRPLERHPTHQLGVDEVARLASDLPDAVILLLPTPGGGVGEPDEERVGWPGPAQVARPDWSGAAVGPTARRRGRRAGRRADAPR